MMRITIPAAMHVLRGLAPQTGHGRWAMRASSDARTLNIGRLAAPVLPNTVGVAVFA